MNATAVLERPFMGQPMTDELPGPGLPPQPAAPAREALPPPSFAERLRQQAEAVRQGDVTVGTLRDLWEVASRIIYYDDGIVETYHAPDGKYLAGQDREAAILLCNMRSVKSWMLDEAPAKEPGLDATPLEDAKLTADDVRFVTEIFGRYSGLCELDIPADELDQLDVARKRLCLTLGIADPAAHTLDQLIEKATARLELHDAITAGVFDSLPRATAPANRRAASTLPPPKVSGRHARPPDSDVLAAQTLAPVPLQQHQPDQTGADAAPEASSPILEGEPTWAGPRRRLDDEPSRPFSGVVRSHRAEVRGRKWFRRVVVAVGMAALFGGAVYCAVTGTLPWQPGPELAVMDAVTPHLPPIDNHLPPLVELPLVPAEPVINLDQFAWNVAHLVAPGQELPVIERAIEAANSQGHGYAIAYTSPDNYQIVYNGRTMTGDQRTFLNQIITSIA